MEAEVLNAYRAIYREISSYRAPWHARGYKREIARFCAPFHTGVCMHVYVCMCTLITGSPPDGHDRDVLGGSKLILAEEAILHVVQGVLIHSVGRTLPLQLEHQHPIVMP